MMKKVLFGLITAATLLLYSCGSTKTESDSSLQPPVEQEETEALENVEEASENIIAEETEETTEQSEQEEPAEQIEQPETEEALEEEYPPLDEILEPEITEITIEEIIKAEEEQKRLEEARKEEAETKIEEPVPEEEVEPPVLTNTDSDADLIADTDTTGEDSIVVTEGSDEVTEDSAEVPEETTEIAEEPEQEEIIITPSRSVTLKKGETLTVTYPGNGWIYMGSTSEYNNLASRGRKLGSTDTKYTLLAKEAGTQIHHFYKTDNLTGEYIDDYLEVIVLDKKGKSSTIVEAPDYAAIVPKKAETPAKSTATKNKEKEQTKAQVVEEEPAKQETETKQTTPAATTKTTNTTSSKATTTTQTNKQPEVKKAEPQDEDVIVIEDEETVTVVEDDTENNEDLSELLTQATDAVTKKQYSQAYEYLVSYLERSTDGRDEALFLLGQLLESDSPLKNIKEAINTYQTLCDNYPASRYWENANKRIIYLKRFYIDIH